MTRSRAWTRAPPTPSRRSSAPASRAGARSAARPPSSTAGHSLGELGALVAAGAIAERDGLELVALRGRLMQEAGEHAGEAGWSPCSAPRRPTSRAIAAGHGLAVANDNAPQQVVLWGARDGLTAPRKLPPTGLRA